MLDRQLFTFLLLTAAVGFLCSTRASAESVAKEWSAVPDADSYEYQVSEDAEFSRAGIKSSGSVKTNHLQLELPSGNYYLRIRALSRESGTGPWSATEDFRVLDKRIRLLKPSDGDEIEIASDKSRIVFSWNPSENAEDYELRIRKSDKSQNRIFITQSLKVEIDGFSPGNWMATLESRKNGQALAESETVRFKTVLKPLEAPKILEPAEEELLNAFDRSRIRWLRKIPGTRSEIVIRKADASNLVIKRLIKDDGAEAEIPELPPGLYQITVRNLTEDSAESSEKSVTVVVQSETEKQIQEADRSWIQLKFTEFIGWGKDTYTNGTTLNGRQFHNGGANLSSLNISLEARINQDWGIETAFSAAFPSLETKNPYTSSEDDYRTDGSATSMAFLAGAHRIFRPWGPLKPLLFRGGVSWHRRAAPFETDDLNQTPSFRGAVAESYALLGLVAGSGVVWGGWNDYWDLSSNLDLEFPIYAYGNHFGTGWPRFYLPDLRLRAELRRRLSSDLSLSFGPFLYLQHLSLSEKKFAERTVESTRLFGICFTLQAKI